MTTAARNLLEFPRAVVDDGAAMAQRFDLHLVVGHGDPEGRILIYGYDPATGGLTPSGNLASGSSTSFLALHPGGRLVYITHNRSNQLGAFRWEGGQLAPLGRVDVPAAPGGNDAGPAHVAVTGSGRHLLAANYRGHNAVVFALEADGRIGALTDSVAGGKHAHFICVLPGDRHVLVPYLGADKVAQYRFDAGTGRLQDSDPPAVTTGAGAGPRHLALHPDGRHAYLLCELDAWLITYALDGERGTLRELHRQDSLPSDYTGRRWAAHIALAPSGRFLYVSNRAHDSLSVFALDHPGQPHLVERQPSGGQTPRHFCLDPAGHFLHVAHQDSGNLVTFTVDTQTGRLTRHAEHQVGPLPYYVNVLPT
jgi:6-phosphogluconolactonase